MAYWCTYTDKSKNKHAGKGTDSMVPLIKLKILHVLNIHDNIHNDPLLTFRKCKLACTEGRDMGMQEQGREGVSQG